MERFVENQQRGLLDERGCKQHEALLARRKLGILSLGKALYVKQSQPLAGLGEFFIGRFLKRESELRVARATISSTGS